MRVYRVVFFMLFSLVLYAGNFDVSVTKQSEWQDGFCANVEVRNLTDQKLEWTVEFDGMGEIYKAWNANYTQDKESLIVTASGVDWNKYIQPHGTVTFGYCANKVQNPSGGDQEEIKEGDLSVVQKENANWNDGFCSNVEVINNTDHDIDWKVEFQVNGEIYNLWNAKYTQDPTTLKVIAEGVDWNNIVRANSKVTFGYCAKKVATTDSDKLALDKDYALLTDDLIKADNPDLSHVTSDLNLPSSLENGSTVSWRSDSEYLTNDGKVKRPSGIEGNQNITLVATLTKGDYSSSKEFHITVLALPLSDNEIVSLDAKNLTFDSIRLANTDESKIVSNLNLLTKGENGSDIRWESSDMSVISTNGEINRGDEAKSVTLTAYISKGDAKESKVFNLTVLAKDVVSDNHDYSKVLKLALKFYEAQRAAGPFPTVTWRKPAALDDGKDVGRDLSKGWFDAGDHVKFNLPMSYSATMLNWGIIEFKNAYVKANALAYAKDQVKYALDYFINAYNEGNDLNSAADDKVYYQVGNPGADHAFWGPPELMTMERPTYTCDANNKCSEVSAGMAAALASGSIVFKDDAEYSALLLQKAKHIYRFAKEYQGNNGYTAANGFYNSYSGYYDELSWAAVWLYLATNDSSYLNDAKNFVTKAQSAIYWAQNWDNVSIGTNLLLAKITNDETYKKAMRDHLNYWLNNIKKTPGGLRFLNQWGSLRYASTTAFIALVYSKELNPALKDSYIEFAKSQIDYILGDNPRGSSYVVGYGVNPPINPHHRAAHNSKTNDINNPVNNEFILEGALVGGPKSADDFDYADDRTDYVANEVATDYNAGFTGALAGLAELFE